MLKYQSPVNKKPDFDITTILIIHSYNFQLHKIFFKFYIFKILIFTWFYLFPQGTIQSQKIPINIISYISGYAVLFYKQVFREWLLLHFHIAPIHPLQSKNYPILIWKKSDYNHQIHQLLPTSGF